MLFLYILKRLATFVPILLVATIGVFAMQALLPGDLAVTLAGDGASKAAVESIRHNLHLNQPLWHQWVTWIWQLLHGNLGRSYITKASVASSIGSAWTVTLALVVGSLLVAIVVSPILALTAARHPRGVFDRVLTIGCSGAMAIPDFVLGMILLIFLTVNVQWFPVQGYVGPTQSVASWLNHLVLPVLCLAIPVAATVTRQLRYALAEVMHTDFVRTARAKGIGAADLMVRHALPAASPPAVAVLGVLVARLLGGVVIVEQVFGLPGLGDLTVTAIMNKDFPIIEGVVPLFVLIALGANLIADVISLLLRPHTIAAAVVGTAG